MWIRIRLGVLVHDGVLVHGFCDFCMFDSRYWYVVTCKLKHASTTRLFCRTSLSFMLTPSVDNIFQVTVAAGLSSIHGETFGLFYGVLDIC